MEKKSKAYNGTLENFFDPIEVYTRYWSVGGVPSLDDFKKFFETYNRQSTTSLL
jgi:hypothetical protein